MTEYYITTIEEQRTESGTEAAVCVRDAEGRPDVLTLTGLNPAFYALTSEVREAEDDLLMNGRVRGVYHGFESLFGDDVSRIDVRTRDDVYELREMFSETFEADLWYSDRVRVEGEFYTGISAARKRLPFHEAEPADVTVPLRVCTFDIETDDRGEFPEPGEKPVLSIVAHDSYDDEYVGFVQTGGRSAAEMLPGGKPEGFDVVHAYPDEESMLAGWADYLSETDPDVLTAWNVDFDAPYLVARFSELGMNPARMARLDYAGLTKRGDARISGRVVYDMLDAYKSSQRTELDSYRLDAVAEEELGENKLDHTGESIYEMWTDDPDKLLRYNLIDVRLVVEIDEATGTMGFRRELAHEVGVGLDGTTANNQFIGMLVRRKLHEWGKVAPTASGGNAWDSYDGAFVLDAYYGVARNVLGMDLASLYPYTMAMLNASPECRVDESFAGPVSVAPNGARFRLDREGLFTSLVNDAIGLKSDYKVEKLAAAAGSAEEKLASVRYAVSKTITNSIYGTLGWARFFLYDEPTAEAVTTMGQVVIKETQSFLNGSRDSEVIYGDTDSNYIQLPADWNKDKCLIKATMLATELNESVYPPLAAEWGMGERECLWEIEVESYAPVFFQAGKKKRYAQRVTWKDGKDTDEVKIKGFDTNRSDTAPLTNDLQLDVLTAILDGADEGKLSSLVFGYSKKLADPATDPEYLAIPQGIGQHFEDYDSPGAHVRGAMYANAIMGTNFGKDDKPRRLYIEPRYFPQVGEEIEVICFEESEELPPEVRPNIPVLNEKLIVKTAGPILEAVGIDMKAALRGQQQRGLADYV